MLAGLVHDGVDLGTDLRNGECGQSVYAVGVGSLIEAQPGAVAGDRDHEPTADRALR
ncbi:hypothetical protein OG948_01955 [Embleya sp. NBC_00888]|uniref:hypothetical protein n=1 Tax=Embleya sp. NBC_00888 TaxID=2975960 RepID=UPI00386A9D78|nr:hypothetical protein OG948_01955 [Embleya sp. NBC_00888]